MRRKKAMEGTIGKYTIVDTLGKGGMSEVYLSRDMALGRNVAIKKLLKKEDSFSVKRNEGRYSHSSNKARAAASLNHTKLKLSLIVGIAIKI